MKAILITEDHYNALGVLRSLGENGISVIIIITSTQKTFIEHSRYVDAFFKIERSEKSIIDTLKKVINDNETYVIYPLSDFAAMVVDDNHNIFSQNVIVPHMHGNMKKYLNKDFVKKEVKKYGFFVAEGKVININEVKDYEWDIFPAILKPVLSIEGVKQDIVIVNDIYQMQEQLEILRQKRYERVLVERFITGLEEHMIEVMGYCPKNHEPVICSIIEKIREYPLQNGSTSYAKIVHHHNGIDEKYIIKFLKNTQFFGLFDMEFKYADGKAYFIECNFRNGAPSYAAKIYGNNIPLLWLQKAIGNVETHKVEKYEDMYFMIEQNDVINMLKGYVSPIKWLIEYTRAKKIFFSIKDFKPVLFYWLNMIKQRLHKKI